MSNLVRHNPYHNTMRMRRAMSRAMAENYARNGGYDGRRTYRLPVDAISTDDDIVLQVSLPGVTVEDVAITYEGDTLTIKGETAPRDEDANYLFAERFSGTFSRTLQLNVPIEGDEIDATFENGVLTITLPKVEAIKPRTIEVKAK